MTGFDGSPARLSAVLSVSAATVGALGHGVVDGAAVGVIGVLILAVGVYRGSRAGVTIGALGVFGGVIVAGLGNAPPEGLLVGTAAAILAWDVAEQSINVGEQLGRAASTARGEVAHAASSVVVAAVVTGLGYVIYVAAAGGQPLAALVLLVVAALALAAALRD